MKQWRTILEIVDVDTGEIITKSEYERYNYIIIKKQSTKDENEKYYIRKITWECERSRQKSLF